MSKQEARLFIARYVSGTSSPEEREDFLKWLEGATIRDLDEITDHFEALEGKWPLGEEPDSIWVDQLEGRLDKADQGAKLAPIKKIGSGRFIKRAVGVAAAVGLVTFGVYKWSSPSGTAPGSPQRPSEVLSEIMSVRRGQEQQMRVLPDGSKVWLNAASLLTYPRSFTGSERTVELTGEAYFEVAKNASMPFRVKVRDMEVEVLGTSFNVSAYEDDRIGKTSLIEGSIKITRGQEAIVLGPGEQAEINYHVSGNSTHVVKGIDKDRVLAWKNGFLQFKDDDLQTVMNEVSRSFDVDVVYADKSKIPVTHYKGTISRKANIYQVLKDLEFYHIHCQIEGKTIKVLP
ncbi:MAG TPA: FecR domain-containing protein [Puia sp.]|nr:FecR domain-containing protein [Puia sp.]